MSDDPTGWRVFIENVINGSNYFRTSEYMRLLEQLEGDAARIATLEEALRRHGLHFATCLSLTSARTQTCDCGLEAALAPKEPL